MPPLTVPRQSV